MQQALRGDRGREHVSLEEAACLDHKWKPPRLKQKKKFVELPGSFFFNIYSIFFYFLWELSSGINYGCELSSSVKPQCEGLTVQPCSGVGRAPNLVLTLKWSLRSCCSSSLQPGSACCAGPQREKNPVVPNLRSGLALTLAPPLLEPASPDVTAGRYI